MRTLCCLFVVVGLFGPFAQADMLEYTQGGGSKGIMEELTFLYKSLHKMVEREDFKSLTRGADGVDVLVVQSGKEFRGKLVAVRFNTSGEVSVISASKIKSLTLDKEYTPPETPAEPVEEEKPKTDEEAKADDEKGDAVKRNQDLGNACAKKAEELEESEKKAVDAKYENDKKELENEVKSLLRSIENKKRRRFEGSAYRNDRGEYNDGLERDYRSIEKAKQKRDQIVASIRKDKKVVEEKAEVRVKRIKVVWSAHRRAIAEGNPPTDEQMIENYKKALNASTTPTKKD